MNSSGGVDGGGVTMVVDVRSDTATCPSEAMKKVMMEAKLGDDVFGEDPTVNALQDKVAALLGKEAALFFPSGTMSNLAAALTHCQKRDSEVILGNQSHMHIYEQGGVAQFGGMHPRPLQTKPDGTFDLDEVRASVRADDIHYPATALVCVENTHNLAGGKVLPMAWMDELGEICRELNLPLHMDGARILNAATALNLPPARLLRDCTSVSMCLSKGLGAPVGTVLAGPKDFIERAKRPRKALGGGMRQCGILAAAGIYAIDNIYPILGRDHHNVQTVAKGVVECGSKVITCDPAGAHTNILMLDCDLGKVTPLKLCQRMAEVTDEEAASLGQRIKVLLLPMTKDKARMVFHNDVTDEMVQSTLRKLQYVIREFDPAL